MTTHVSETFRFCPSCGSKKDIVGVSPFRCDDCDFRLYFSPVTAVGGIIVNRDREILLLIRARDPGKGKYGLPGGFVDPGETLETSLIREVLEETALTVTKANYLCSFPNSYTHHDVTIDVMDAFYVCEVESFADLKAQPDEVESFFVGALNSDILSQMAFDSNRRAINVFLANAK